MRSEVAQQTDSTSASAQMLSRSPGGCDCNFSYKVDSLQAQPECTCIHSLIITNYNSVVFVQHPRAHTWTIITMPHSQYEAVFRVMGCLFLASSLLYVT
jgi:hypothetical protein